MVVSTTPSPSKQGVLVLAPSLCVIGLFTPSSNNLLKSGLGSESPRLFSVRTSMPMRFDEDAGAGYGRTLVMKTKYGGPPPGFAHTQRPTLLQP